MLPSKLSKNTGGKTSANVSLVMGTLLSAHLQRVVLVGEGLVLRAAALHLV